LAAVLALAPAASANPLGKAKPVTVRPTVLVKLHGKAARAKADAVAARHGMRVYRELGNIGWFLLTPRRVASGPITRIAELRSDWASLSRDPSVAGYHPVIRGLLDDARPAPPAPEPAAAAPPAPAASWSVFLCHSSGDKEQVRALYERLTADGVPCWLDQEMLLAGQDWDREIRRAIRASRFVLACVSRESVAKTGYVQAELRRALEVADEQPEGSTFIIPVRLDDCVIPDSLGRWQWVDLFGDSGYGRLLRVLTAR